MKKFTLFLTMLLALVGSKAQADTDDGLLDRTSWSITTSSECTDNSSTGYGHANHIIDGNTTSYWHTYWNGASNASGDQTENLPQFFIVDLGEVKEFNSFAYLPRATSGGGANGTATHIKMFVSTDAFDTSASSASAIVSAQTATPAFDMDLSYSSDAFTQYKVGTSETTLSGRYVMFVITAANVGAVKNKYASCCEFYLGSKGDASYYSLIDESKITALESNSGTNLGQYNATKVNDLRTKYTNKTLTITEFYNALNSSLYLVPEVGKYYRFVSKRAYDSSVLGMNGSYVNVTANSAQNTDANNIWKLVAIDGEDGVKFENPNTGKYIGALAAAPASASTSPALTDFTNGSKFTLQPTGDGSFYLLDGNSHKMNCENSGIIDYWDTTTSWGATVTSNRWLITEATSIDVALASVTGKTSTYASAYLPFSISGVENATAYLGAFNSDKTSLQMTETESVPANTGFVLVSEDGNATATLTFGDSSAETTNNALTGTKETITFSDDNDTRSSYLVFGVNSGNVGFYTPSSNVAKIPANKAYLDASALSQSAIALNFGGGDVTGVTSAQAESAAANAPIFDLSGRRVVKASKGGVYIQNGKKFVK